MLSAGQPSAVWSGKVVTIHIESSEWAFNQTNPVITVNLGDKVRVMLFNNGTVPHNFAIPGLTEAETGIIPPGSTGELEFIASKSEEFNYICSVPGHAKLGMRGAFVVKASEE